MPKLISLNPNTSCPDDWVLLSDTDILPNDCTKALLPLDVFLANVDSLEKCGVWLNSDQDPYALSEYLNKVSVVACQFQVFADGRSFSQARILREHMEFSGEIRAIGNFIQDQLHYLLRCGFTEFSVENDADEASLRESLADFSESYQAGCDVPAPLFRRRA